MNIRFFFLLLFFTVSIHSEQGRIHIKSSDNGQKVLETKESSFSIAGLIQGMYTVKMFDQSGAISIQKLIIR